MASHLPHVQAFYPIVVQHVEQAVDPNADFRQVREDIFLTRWNMVCLPCLCIDLYVQPCVSVFLACDHSIISQMVIGKLFATGVKAARFLCLLWIILYSRWMLVSLYFSFAGSEPLTAWKACARVISNTRSL